MSDYSPVLAQRDGRGLPLCPSVAAAWGAPFRGPSFADERGHVVVADDLKHVRASVLDALLEHTSLVHDDVTFMVVEVTGETKRGPAN